MKRENKIFIAFTAVLIAAALFTAIALGFIVSPLITKAYAYAVYGLAAAFLTAAAIFYFSCKNRIKSEAEKVFSPAAEKLKKQPLLRDIAGDYSKKTLVVSVFTAAFNLAYLIYLIWVAIAYLSPWYASMAGFYAFLVLSRSAVLLTERYYAKKSQSNKAPYPVKCKIFIGAGAANIVGGAVMSIPVLMMSVGEYPQGAEVINIVVNALFALIKTSSAVMQCVRSFKEGDFTSRALRNMGIITALMSLQMLEMTIVNYTTGADIMWLMVAVIGGIADGITIITGITMIVQGAAALKKTGETGAENGEIGIKRDDNI